MPKVWNIGNTTVRNPKRIENALRVFSEEGFSGHAKGSEAECGLHAKLKERDVLEYDGEASDWNGRKWRAAFYQLGFISYEKYQIGRERYSVKGLFSAIGLPRIDTAYQLTPAGEKLISAGSVPEIEELYTRQFVCYELPNSLEGGFPNGSIKPFILLLQVLKLLQEKDKAGLDKFETGLFLQRFRNHTAELPRQIVEEVLEFRRCLGECVNAAQVRQVRERYARELAAQTGIRVESVLRDYSDTTFRYFSLSGLFSLEGQRLVIRQNKRSFVDELLCTEPRFVFRQNPLEYFRLFYENTYPLPIDNRDFALNEIKQLKAGVAREDLLKEADRVSGDADLQKIQAVRLELVEYNNREREVEYARRQQSPAAIDDILDYLRVLNGERFYGAPGIDDKPAYLEWAVWRSFLAIDEIVCPIHQTRRFPVDQDFYPRNTAPGGGADIVFEFETYALVVEVTMTASTRQMAVEHEPVKRHTVQYAEQHPGKQVYCLFVAPSVDNNIAENFRSGCWFKGDEEVSVDVVPMELADFIVMIERLRKRRFRNCDFRGFLNACLSLREQVRAPQWKKCISEEASVFAN